MYLLPLMATLWYKQKQYSYYPYFTDGKTEVQRVLDSTKTIGFYAAKSGPEFLVF